MTHPAPVIFNPFTPEFVADPYPHYAELREADPVHQHPMGVWFLWTYAEANAMLRDGRSVDERALNVSALTPVYREISGGRLPRANGQMLMELNAKCASAEAMRRLAGVVTGRAPQPVKAAAPAFSLPFLKGKKRA